MTVQQRHLWILLAVIAIASYMFLPSIIGLLLPPPRPRPPAIKRSTPKRTEAPKAAPATLAPSETLTKPPLANLPGKWGGSAALPARGACQLGVDFEVEEDGNYVAYTVFNCIPLGPHQPRLNPSLTVLEGTAKDGALVMHVKKTLGYASLPKNCAITEFTVTPWGPRGEALIADWHDACSGGQLTLRRVK
jgi:hypothetical protein